MRHQPSILRSICVGVLFAPRHEFVEKGRRMDVELHRQIFTIRSPHVRNLR
jgi:hypothetical protein